MKKFLSLVLALVMTMSLVTISAGAKDFTDDDKITYEEAVNVISTIGVVGGYPDGSFDPQGALTRGAAAKIICNMILGPTTAAELRADTAPFKDVPTDHTFAGYIAYCAKEGIISGYADGTFRPAGTLTGYAFMKMLLGALGYDAKTEGYTGANWSINVAKQALAIGLNNSLEGDFNGVKAVNREEACLYAFNTLQADLVEYETIISTVINGTQVNVGNSKAKAMEWLNSATRHSNIEDDKYIQFAEQYFTKLILDKDTDAFGRPTRDWEFNGKEIGSYVNRDLLVESYSEKVTGKDLYELLGKSTIEDYEFSIYIDGETSKAVLEDYGYFTKGNLVKGNTEKVGATGDGVTTEVYVDVDKKEVTIAVINTYLAVVEDDYDEKDEELDIKIYGLDDISAAGSKLPVYVKDTDIEGIPETLSIDDFDVEDYKEDDILLVTVAEGEVQTIAEPEVLSKTTITKFKQGSNVTADGEKYDYADTAVYDPKVLDKYDQNNMKDVTYNVILDQYGFLIGIEQNDDPDQYVFVTGLDGNDSNLSNKNADVGVIFVDGTMDVVTVDSKESTWGKYDPAQGKIVPLVSTDYAQINTWYTYTTDKNGVYTLEVVAGAIDADNDVAQSAQDVGTSGKDIDKKNVSLKGGLNSYKNVYGNDETAYLNVELDVINAAAQGGVKPTVIIDDVESVTVGVKNVKLTVKDVVAADYVNAADVANTVVFSNEIYTLYNDDGYVIAAVVVGENEGISSNYAYVTSKTGSKGVNSEGYDSTEDEYTWTRKVVVDGKVTELTEVGSKLKYLKDMNQGEWYEVKYDAKGNVRKVEPVTFGVNGTPAGSIYEYITEVDDVETSVNTHDTVILQATYKTVDAAELTFDHGTLYTDTALTKGFSVSPDVKVVLCLADSKGKQFDDVDDDYSGYTGLEKAIRNLDNKNDPFIGDVSAILEDGVATTVILNDAKASNVDFGETDSTGDFKESAVINGLVINIQELDGVDNRIALAEAALEKAGYTVTDVSYNQYSDEYTFTAKKGSVTGYNFTTNTEWFYEVKVEVDSTFTYANLVDSVTKKIYVSENTTAEVEIEVLSSTAGFSVGEGIKSTDTSFSINSDIAPGGKYTLKADVKFATGAGAANKTLTLTWGV